MIIDFQQAKLQKFMALAMKIEAQPELYVQFDSVSDFYKADWLRDFMLDGHILSSSRSSAFSAHRLTGRSCGFCFRIWKSIRLPLTMRKPARD